MNMDKEEIERGLKLARETALKAVEKAKRPGEPSDIALALSRAAEAYGMALASQYGRKEDREKSPFEDDWGVARHLDDACYALAHESVEDARRASRALLLALRDAVRERASDELEE